MEFIEYLFNLKINNYQVLVFGYNILLSLIPCFLAYKMGQIYQLKKWPNLGLGGQVVFLVLFLLWFFTFPNTAYLITDIRHLVNYCDNPGLLRVCRNEAYLVPIFFTYALIGVPTFYYALSRMSKVLRRLFNKTVGKLFPLFMIPITVIGVMLGLVGRYNSWDIAWEPFKILHTTFKYLSDPIMLLNIGSYTVMLYLIYFFLYFSLKAYRA